MADVAARAGVSLKTRVVAELLDQPDPPTAFFSLNNRITLGVIEELHRIDGDQSWPRTVALPTELVARGISAR
ncbi:hypothetical protein AB0J72_25620 [Dactylosporangium sp. NPDC049742]|uniref:hypothetical protein n=1 Tax=Dactylosporangium sp. NPDC049742 TaxID=3154737 RepID=UPI00342138B5